MVNPLGQWIHISFGSRFWILLMGLSGFQGIGFRIPLRGLSGVTGYPRIGSSSTPSSGSILLVF